MSAAYYQRLCRCGAPIDASAPSYYTVCRSCFAQSKRSEVETLRAERDRAIAQVAGLQIELGRLRSRLPGIELDPARLRELLQLVHPDKHAGSPLAARTTAWLLNLRDQRRAAA